MINIETKQQLIDEFCLFIEDLPDLESAIQIGNEKTIDLFTVCKELIALRTEVKQESRQFKGALESFKEVFNTLQQSHATLTQELAQRRQDQDAEIEKHKNAVLKPLLLDLIELRDRLEIGLTHHKTYKVHKWMPIFKRIQTLFASMHEGQMMTLRRLDQLLSNYEVCALKTDQEPFDPHCMRVVAVEHHADLSDGIVVAEMRKGFRWKDEILRVAEVKVNKTEE